MPLHSLEEKDAGKRFSDRWLQAIVALSVFIRIVYLLQFRASPLNGLYRADHQFYRDWAVEISTGVLSPGHIFEQGPLYAYLVGLIYAVVGTNETLLFLFQLACGVLTVLLVYAIGCAVFDIWIARIAAFLCCLYGPAVFYETMVMKTCITPLLTTVTVWGTVNAIRSPRRGAWLAVAAVAAGMLTLVRENYVLIVPIISVVGLTLPAASRKECLIFGTLPIVIVLAITLPATLHNYNVSGKAVWVTSGGGEVLYIAWGAEATGYYQPPFFVRPDPIVDAGQKT